MRLRATSTTTVWFMDGNTSDLVAWLLERGMRKADMADTGRLWYRLYGDGMELEIYPPSYTGSAQVVCRGENRAELAALIHEYATGETEEPDQEQEPDHGWNDFNMPRAVE